MHNAVKELKLNSSKFIPMFVTTLRKVNVYFKSKSGKPVYRVTAKNGGWDILHEIADANHRSSQSIVDDFKPAIYVTHVQFDWPQA